MDIRQVDQHFVFLSALKAGIWRNQTDRFSSCRRRVRPVLDKPTLEPKDNSNVIFLKIFASGSYKHDNSQPKQAHKLVISYLGLYIVLLNIDFNMN